MSDDLLEAGRLLFARPWTFWRGTPDMKHMPPMMGVEIAFAGRSNVGKSSLINALTGRKGIARASNIPGRTQEINYFALGDHSYLVDLPGYGYAQAPVDNRLPMLVEQYASWATNHARTGKAGERRPERAARVVDQGGEARRDHAVGPHQRVDRAVDHERRCLHAMQPFLPAAGGEH